MLLYAGIAAMIFPMAASADEGPKPSVNIIFENMGDEVCYGTLLTEDETLGPMEMWGGSEENISDWAFGSDPYSDADRRLDRQAWEAFVRYQDADGYHYLQETWRVSKTKRIDWGYIPPQRFKILLYYPEAKTFVTSGIYERYAFDTYYTVEMDGMDMSSVEYDEEQSSDNAIIEFRTERIVKATMMYTISFLRRVVTTVLVEMATALLFGLREKKQILFIMCVNIGTQFLLNFLLNASCFVHGENDAILFSSIYYLLCEFLVFAIEAVIYCAWMKKISTRPRKNWYYVLYALAANVLSFGMGYIIPMFSWMI